jgi:cobalamin synthase
MIGFSFAGTYFFTVILTGLFFSYLITIFIRSKIGFVNGDVLGAALEGVEIILFLGVALCL